MLTCFLFIQDDDLSEILSIRMDLQGKIEQPLALRTVEEIRNLQDNARTIIVFPTGWCGLYQVELPLLPERKAREAIPYALEDQLAQPVTQVHFVFDKAYYHEGHYLVVVIDKQTMSEWMTKLSDLDLNYDVITIDWFALQEGEGWVDAQTLTIRSPVFQGSLSLDIWDHYPQEWASDVAWHVFKDSPICSEWSEGKTHLKTSPETWIAERLFNRKNLNLCQGEFQHATSQSQVKRWYQLTGMAAIAWLVCFIGIQFGFYKMLAHKTQAVDQDIAKSYRVFFPGAQQVISPKIRISQLLKQHQLGNNASLWSLIESFSSALVSPSSQTTKSNAPTPRVQSLQFQNQVLTVLFHCDNFSALEQIESALQTKHVKVHQVSAATEDDRVVAKLELSL